MTGWIGHETTEADGELALLLVEDSASQALLLRDALTQLQRPRVRVQQSFTVTGALGALAREDFDVVMLDLDLPDAAGLDGVRRVRSSAPRAALIVRTRSAHEQRGLDALAAGAHEHVLKDAVLSPEMLGRSIRVAMARQRAEAAGQELAALMDTGDDAIIGLTLQGRITSWDEAAERIYGYSAAEAVDREVSFLAGSSGARRELRRRLAKLTAGNGPEVLESLHRCADGSTIDVLLRLSATSGPAQQTAQVVAVVRDVSAEKRAERERARILARLRETQRIARLGFWTLDVRNGAVTWSPEMHRMFARSGSGGSPTKEEWLGYVASRERSRVDALLSGVTGGREFAFDCHVGPASDAERTIHVIGRGDPDDPEVLLGTAQDMTELRAVERALRASRGELVEQRELLAAVVDDAPTGMALVPVSEDRFLRVNRALCAILGYSDEELLGATFSGVTHPEDLPRGREAAARLLAGELPSYQTQIRYLHKDGHVIWAEISASLIRDDAGEPLYFVVLISDISERKAVEQALQQERDHTGAILAAIGEGYALSLEGRISEINEALCTLTGYSRQELIGAEPPWPFWPEGGAAWSAENPPPEEVIITQMVRRDGSRFQAEVNARAAHNPDGSVLGWVIAIRDVSERQRYEAELERLATHDALTGLANHRLFHQRLAEEVAKAARHARPLSVAVLDLDHFKQINDAHGHLVGDGALAAVAGRLRAVVREGELLARVGGEEFAWILPDADEQGAFIAAERARHAVSGEGFAPAGRITLSAGVACREQTGDASSLYEHADRALLAAKRAGRNQTMRWADLRVVG